MIQVILFSSRQEELSEIRRQMGVVSFRFPRVESELQGTADLSQWQEWGRQNGVDALICDVGVDGAVNALEAVKQWNPQALVFPIAGMKHWQRSQQHMTRRKQPMWRRRRTVPTKEWLQRGGKDA